MMKRLVIYLIFPAIATAVLTACQQVNQAELTKESEVDENKSLNNITMQVEQDTISPKGLTIILTNKTDEEVTYGGYYLLEKKQDGKWYELPPILKEGEYGFTAIAYIIEAQSQAEMQVDWKELYGKLGSGDYRIVKDMLVGIEEDTYETYYLIAEFKID